ncbi:MAG TPA: 50S ribosomal protein L10 [Tissierellia bacterium]|jgi:large subunit ribosomal protein L10|nr:50S ribosomal protein L10 [Tissierellia bacterium]
MSKNRELKELRVSEIRDRFSRAKSAVVVDYRGLNVAEVTELRNRFRESEVEYRVFKNRLVKLALEGTGFEELESELTGPNAIAFGYDDAVKPAKVARDFSKKNTKLEIKGGIVENVFYDASGIKAIADIPSRETLIAKFLGSVQSPISKLAYVLGVLAEKEEA